ncbi:MAG: hypothetical protein FJ303_00140 [Planctomycetes bacterium]|nr:hypothetical protein [Planctomycetota bacterium]
MKTAIHIVAIAILLGVTPSPSFATPKEKKKAHEVLTLMGGVLIDPVEKAIFVAKTVDGIEAIDIATGKTLWQTKKEEGTYWPVAVYGRTLVVRVRANPLRIAALDLDAKGRMLWMTEPVLPEWVKGPEWLKDKPRHKREAPEWVPESERAKPTPQELLSAALDELVKGSYRCEERIEKGEFVMRWRAASDAVFFEKPNSLPNAKEASGVVVVDLETDKIRTQPLSKDRRIEEHAYPPSVEWNGIDFSVAVGKHVGDWVKTLPASRRIIESRLLRAVEKKTGKLLWERTLWEWGYKETRRVNGG